MPLRRHIHTHNMNQAMAKQAVHVLYSCAVLNTQVMSLRRHTRTHNKHQTIAKQAVHVLYTCALFSAQVMSLIRHTHTSKTHQTIAKQAVHVQCTLCCMTGYVDVGIAGARLPLLASGLRKRRSERIPGCGGLPGNGILASTHGLLNSILLFPTYSNRRVQLNLEHTLPELGQAHC